MEKSIHRLPNQKSWMTGEVRKLLKDRNIAFKSEDKVQYSTSRPTLNRGIMEAKEAYKQQIEKHLMHKDPRQIWQGLQQLTIRAGLIAWCSRTVHWMRS